MAIDPSLPGHVSSTRDVPSVTRTSVTAVAVTQESPAGRIDRRGSVFEQVLPKG
jgi:hypothetical protein